jgi:glycosyltransferase involved in cell wall biosynthesis
MDAEPPGRRLRVLAVGHGSPNAGGIPSYLARLVDDPTIAAIASVEHLNTAPPAGHRPGSITPSNAWRAIRQAMALVRRSRTVDIVHLNVAPAPWPPLLRSLALAVAARMGRAHVLLHAHSGRLEEASRSPVHRALLWVAARVVDRVVVVSSEGEQAVRRVASNVILLPNGVDPAGFDTGPKADPPVLVFVGTVCERKGLVDLRDALVRLRDETAEPSELRVRIVGDAKQEGPGVFERIVEGYAASGLGAVEFTGALDPAGVRRALAEASIFCLPSFWEGFPLSLLEGMAAAAAPVATSVGEIPAILDQGRAGILVAPRDPGALAEAIGSLLRDEAARAELGSAARARVEGRYSQASAMRRLAELYAEVGPAHRRRPHSM